MKSIQIWPGANDAKPLLFDSLLKILVGVTGLLFDRTAPIYIKFLFFCILAGGLWRLAEALRANRRGYSLTWSHEQIEIRQGDSILFDAPYHELYKIEQNDTNYVIAPCKRQVFRFGKLETEMELKKLLNKTIIDRLSPMP